MVVALALLGFGQAWPAWAGTTNVLTLAIVDLETNKVCGDLLFDALAKRTDIRLVEREQMARILSEQDLSALSSDAVKVGKMVGADGLIFLEDEADLLHVRLTETARGVRLFDLVLQPKEARSAIPQMEVQIDRSGRKLRLPEARRTYLAVFTFDQVFSTNVSLREMAALHTLIGMHLATADTILLVERERLGDIVSERELSNQENVLRTATWTLRGRIQAAGGNRVRVDVQLRHSLDHSSVEFSAEDDATNRTAIVEQLSSALLAKLGASTTGPATSLSDEANLYAQNGLKYLDHRNLTAALASFSVADLLQPGNPAWAAPFMDAASRQLEVDGLRIKHTPRSFTEANYTRDVAWFQQAAQAALRVGARNVSLPKSEAFITLGAAPPGLTERGRLVAQQERATFRELVEQVCPIHEARNGHKHFLYVAENYPFLFDEPKDAMAYLRGLTASPDFPWNTIHDPKFNKVRYWDTNQAARLWSGFLSDLKSSGVPEKEFAAFVSSCALAHVFEAGTSTWSHNPNTLGAASNLFAWLTADPSRLDWLCDHESDFTRARIWVALALMDDAFLEANIDCLMMPLGRCSRGRWHYALDFIWSQCERRGKAKISTARRALLAQFQKRILDEASRDGGTELAEIHERYGNNAWFQELAGEIKPAPASQFPDIPAGELVFDTATIDAGDAPRFDAWGAVFDDHAMWCGWAVSGAVRIARLPVSGGPPELWTVPGDPIECAGACDATPLDRVGSWLCVRGSTTLTFVPVGETPPFLRPEAAIVLGPELGGASLGYQMRRGETRLTAVAGTDDGIYIGLDSETGEGGSHIIQGSLLYWKPGTSNCQVICASDSLMPGPFNDCTPYAFAAIWVDGKESLNFAVAKSPPDGMTEDPLPGMWRFEPATTNWVHVLALHLGPRCGCGRAFSRLISGHALALPSWDSTTVVDLDTLSVRYVNGCAVEEDGGQGWSVELASNVKPRREKLVKKGRRQEDDWESFSVSETQFHIVQLLPRVNGIYVLLSNHQPNGASPDPRGLIYRLPIPR